MPALAMDDAAVRLPGLHGGLPAASLSAGIGPRLRAAPDAGLSGTGRWSPGPARRVVPGARAGCCGRTARECSGSFFYLEGFVPAGAVVADALVITGAGRRTLPARGLTFILRSARPGHGLRQASLDLVITGVSESNATFRFGRVRDGERWHGPALTAARQARAPWAAW